LPAIDRVAGELDGGVFGEDGNDGGAGTCGGPAANAVAVGAGDHRDGDNGPLGDAVGGVAPLRIQNRRVGGYGVAVSIRHRQVVGDDVAVLTVDADLVPERAVVGRDRAVVDVDQGPLGDHVDYLGSVVGTFAEANVVAVGVGDDRFAADLEVGI